MMIVQSGFLLRAVALLVLLAPGSEAQIAAADLRGAMSALAADGRWNLDAPRPEWFSPRPGGGRGELELTSRGPGLRYFTLGLLEMGPKVVVRGRLREPDDGRLFVLLASDPRRNRGLAIEFGAPGAGGVRVWRLTPEGAESVARGRRGPALRKGGRFAVSWDGRRLKVAWVGLPVFGDSGLALTEVPSRGRIQLAVQGGSVVIEDGVIQGRPTATSLRRLRTRATATPLRFPAAPSLPLREIYALPSAEWLFAGLEGPLRRRAAALRASAIAGTGLRDLGAIEALGREASRSAPGRVRFDWLAGAIRLSEVEDWGRAARFLERSPGPHTPSLLVEARLAEGVRRGLDPLLEAIAPPHGSLALRWMLARARGDEPAAPDFSAARAVTCRRCAARRQRVRDLMALRASERMHRAGDARLRVYSDLDVGRARRLHAQARRFLDRALLGPRAAREIGVEVVAFSDPELLDAWNDRFGGGGHHPVSGVYHPGWGLAVILDDADLETTLLRLRHELAHHLMVEAGWSRVRRGMEEGLAELLARGVAPGALRGPAGLEAAADASHLGACFESAATARLRDAADALWRDPWAEGGDLEREDYAAAWLALRHLQSETPRLWRTAFDDEAFLERPGTWTPPSAAELRRYLHALGERPLGWSRR